MGIYFESDVGQFKVLNFVISHKQLEIKSIEYWLGYPLESVGGKLLKTEYEDFGTTQGDFDVIVIWGRIQGEDEYFTFILNERRVMKDKAQYSLEFDSDHIDVSSGKWMQWQKEIAHEIHESLEPYNIIIGKSDDCVDARYEIPLYVIQSRTKRRSGWLYSFIRLIAPKSWRDYRNLEIPLVDLFHKFLSENERFLTTATKVSSPLPKISVMPGSTIIEIASEDEWEQFKLHFAELLNEFVDDLPNEKSIFEKWERKLKRNKKGKHIVI